ncbi:hypothetical protein IKE71_02525 [Candidatus Saccharibacteria bacterium]|nr:hypothetical protein [Candidatus Saccharibacteria bacterium]
MNNGKQKTSLPLIFAISALVIFLVFLLINKTAVVDTFKGFGYNPTPEMATVKQSLELTADGERIFNATRPLLASSEDFNYSCESHDEEVSVLGCYTGDRIYVYNVSDTKLSGIRESTSAHELLHAVWNRLPGVEKSALIPLLESFYSKNPDLKETIDAYAESERLDELYVRVGTQIADLSTELESHYSRYFKDQDKIVSFYTAYITPFNELKTEIESLKSELDALEKEINEKSAALDARAAAFDAAVSEFNNCANTAGCFTSNAAFASRRAELVAEQQAINSDNSSLNSLIDAYNKKVETYNSSVVRSSELQSLINSNSTESKIEE